MFDHVTLRVSDIPASHRFYHTLLEPLGRTPDVYDDFVEWEDFSIKAVDDRPATRGLHIAFVAPSRAAVDQAWQAGVDAGYPDDGAPGERPQYSPSYYGAFLTDPDGNSAEVVHRNGMRRDGYVDHLWLRVRDLAAARAFYETIAEPAGLEILPDSAPGRASFGTGDGGTFSLLEGEHPTSNLHVAFGARDHATVEAFHAAAIAAGYADNGAPGERPEWHAGYYGAFVFDPDGSNIEVVDHGRP